MPFRLLQSIKKAKAEKLKNKSKSTTDLYMGRSRLASEPTLTLHQKMEIVTKMKPKVSLFSHSKAVTPNQTNENGRDSNENFTEDLPQLRKVSLESDKSPLATTDHSRVTQQRQSEPTLPYSVLDAADVATRSGRSASCHSIVEGAKRERRMSDLNQLDQYIEYHQRRSVADSGSSTSRLVCAQLLRESLARLQQTARPERPPFKSEHSRSMSSLNYIQNTTTSSTTDSFQSDSTTSSSADTHSSPHHFQKNKISNLRRKLSQWNLAPVTQERRSSLGYICNIPAHNNNINTNNTNFNYNNASHHNSNNNINASHDNNNNNNNNDNGLSYVNSYNSDCNTSSYHGSNWSLADTSITNHESQVSYRCRDSNSSGLSYVSANGQHFDSLPVPTDMFTPRSFWRKHKLNSKRRKSMPALPIEIEIY